MDDINNDRCILLNEVVTTYISESVLLDEIQTEQIKQTPEITELQKEKKTLLSRIKKYIRSITL